jgi:hypothetical protein
MVSPIQPYANNPRFWQYKDRPVRLLGGSVEDNLFQINGLEDHLDLIASCGGNYVRCTMSSRDEGDVWPYALETASGLYDLNRSGTEYWRRFSNFLEWTFQRDIIVQIECWDRFDFSREPWLNNPFNPKNNLNYSPTESGLAADYPDHPNANRQPFFYTLPELDDNSLILKYQADFIERMLSISLPYPHVLYCMDNETSGAAEWGAYWASFIHARAQSASQQVYLTEMWDQWDITGSMHDATFGHPEIYGFVDISQNNQISGEAHWTNMQRRWLQLAREPRPMNMVKIYGADGNKFGHTDDDGIARFWRGLLGGMASLRFHRPPSGLGLNSKAQVCLRSARILSAEWDWLNSIPDSDHRLLAKRAEDGAYLSYLPTKQYVVYFPRQGKVSLDLRQASTRFTLRWLNILKSVWEEDTQVQGGNWLDLESPAGDHWLAFLTAPGQ